MDERKAKKKKKRNKKSKLSNPPGSTQIANPSFRFRLHFPLVLRKSHKRSPSKSIQVLHPPCTELCQFALHLSWRKKPVLLHPHPHPHPTKHGVTMSSSVSVAKIPALDLLTTSLMPCIGAGFTPLEMTENSREGKLSKPSLRRQSRRPGFLL